MIPALEKFPYLLELVCNGLFISLYTLARINRVPEWLKFIPSEWVTHWAVLAAPFFVLFTLITHYRLSTSVEDFFRKYVFSLIIFVPMLLTFADAEFIYWLSVVHLFSTLISLNEKTNQPTRERSSGSLGWLYELKLSPAQLILISFASLILIGALLLVLPIAAQPGKKNYFC